MSEREATNPSGGTPTRRGRSRWWVIGGVLALVTAAGVIEALQLMMPGARMSGYEGVPGFLKALSHTVPSWWILALLIPAGWWLGTRFPLLTARWKRNAALHVVASLVFPFVLFGLVAVFYGLLNDDLTMQRMRGTVFTLADIYYVYYVFIYWLIVGAVHVLRYYRAVKDHEIAELQLRSDLSQARLSALRAQLNPHFLFNSLNTIVGLALERGHEEVADAVTELSELLRESLRDDEARLVPLRKELEFTRRYLSLQKHRFGDRLDFTFDAAPSIQRALVPAMLLQPLVENAVLHGILPAPGPGTVTVRARREDDRLALDVEDSGTGFPAEPDPAADGHGLGLRNTRARLQHLFGGECELAIGSAADGGARVTVLVPYVTADEPAEAAGALA